MSFLFYPEVEPYPTTYVSHTYPEKGHRLHHVPLPYLAHKAHAAFHDKDLDVHQPRADLRETMKSFYIEVELPGIADKSQLHLRWTSLRTLLISSKLSRPEIPEDELYDVPVIKSKPTSPSPEKQEEAPVAGQEETAPPKTSTPSTHTIKKEPHLTVHERQIGELLRAFHFPVDVNRDETHAKLDAGLLKIIVPKLDHDQNDHVTVPVRNQDSPTENGPSV